MSKPMSKPMSILYTAFDAWASGPRSPVALLTKFIFMTESEWLGSSWAIGVRAGGCGMGECAFRRGGESLWKSPWITNQWLVKLSKGIDSKGAFPLSIALGGFTKESHPKPPPLEMYPIDRKRGRRFIWSSGCMIGGLNVGRSQITYSNTSKAHIF